MSGTQKGNPPTPAPGRTILSLLLAEPAILPGGQLTNWLAQFLIRLSSYVGAADGSGQTITDQTNSNTRNLALTIGQPVPGGFAQGLVAGLEGIGGQGLLPPPAPVPSDAVPLVLGALEPWLTSDDIPVPAAGGIYAPLVNGDLPGPTLVATPDGQCVMCEVV